MPESGDETFGQDRRTVALTRDRMELRWFHQKYQNYSEINITLNTYKWQGWYTNVPIYLVGNIKKIISKK